MKYPLAAIESIRKRREERAILALATARAKVIRCQQNLEEAEKAFEDYVEWCENEARRLLDKLMQGTCTANEHRDTYDQIRWNRSQQGPYKVKCDEANKALEESQEEELEAKHVQEAASKKAWTLDFHHTEWTKDKVLLEAQVEEDELEEVAAQMYFQHRAA